MHNAGCSVGTELLRVSFSVGEEEQSPLLLGPLNDLVWKPRVMTYDDDCGAICRMLGRDNTITRRKPAPMLPCRLQIPHDLTRD
jgi:hypothetical protein